jgi:hypothetical protein
MRRFRPFAVLACLTLAATGVQAQSPGLPAGARTNWIVAEPEEIVAYMAFDPAGVQDRLPARLRFITIKELADGGVGWATTFLGRHAGKGGWGVSFVEVVRMGTFTIDRRSPSWPTHGAAALWFARVAPSDPSDDLGPGRPLLALEFLIPDKAYVAYMREKGYPATFGDVTLQQSAAGEWAGAVRADDLTIAAGCTPVGRVSGGPTAAGAQSFFPPATSSVRDVVRVSFAGHRERACEDAGPWTIRGTHPLANAIQLESAIFEFGYHLVGGSYPR